MLTIDGLISKSPATADQKRDVVAALAALGCTRSSLVFATVASVNMSVRVAEQKVKNAAQESIEKGTVQALSHTLKCLAISTSRAAASPG